MSEEIERLRELHYNLDTNKPIDRFDLEDAIMKAWQTSDDLKLLYENIENIDEDQTMNVLIGLHQLNEMRFNKLWNTFEQVLQNGGFSHVTDIRDSVL